MKNLSFVLFHNPVRFFFNTISIIISDSLASTVDASGAFDEHPSDRIPDGPLEDGIAIAGEARPHAMPDDDEQSFKDLT